MENNARPVLKNNDLLTMLEVNKRQLSEKELLDLADEAVSFLKANPAVLKIEIVTSEDLETMKKTLDLNGEITYLPLVDLRKKPESSGL